MNFDLFKSNNWNSLNIDERVNALQKFENYIANQEGRSARTVFADDLDYNGKNVNGMYNPTNGLNENLYIDIDHLNSDSSYEVMKTALHEGRHAYQDDICNGRINDEEITGETKEKWLKNEEPEAYIGVDNPASKFFTCRNFPAYYTQPIEDDAEQFAVDKMNGLGEYFADDPDYAYYMNKINKCREDNLSDAAAVFGDDYKNEVENIINDRCENKEAIMNYFNSKNNDPLNNNSDNASDEPYKAKENGLTESDNDIDVQASNENDKYDFLYSGGKAPSQEKQNYENNENVNNNKNENTI